MTLGRGLLVPLSIAAVATACNLVVPLEGLTGGGSASAAGADAGSAAGADGATEGGGAGGFSGIGGAAGSSGTGLAAGSSGTGGTIQGCSPQEVKCGEECVDLRTSAAHCGACFYTCPLPKQCVEAQCTTASAPSCGGLGDVCGAAGTDSCCAAAPLPAGTFPMGRCDDLDSALCTDAYAGFPNELPEHAVTLSAFLLDRFEVSVGRFRRFLENYPTNRPSSGDGAHPSILASGWQSDWDSSLPVDQTALLLALKCSGSSTWTDTPGANEAMAINCVSWFEAFAFCAWDLGRLPTEAEWEYASAGGTDNRLFPWGPEAPDASRANFGESAKTPFLRVGSYLTGASKWGQFDLAGGMREWVLDGYSGSWYSGAGSVCNNCANLSTSYRVVRGGGYSSDPPSLRATDRVNSTPDSRFSNYGFRCARTPK